ncbi:S41 family peptidase [Lentimicrobium sp. S6]|uniref:S41 family peptidase n=1 Tax=Lentimicrobium sp. S6 TaxID=2735872 RepID=UPI00155751F3|nr:S41 family peptidase [Lentimicrobium sp. S6]NPD47290.1 hypothetical protein [Lentimicrobium sp. S6]
MKIGKLKFNITLIIFSIFALQPLFSQQKINWEEDLDYLKNYLEIVHPALHAYVTEEAFDNHFNYIRDNCKTLDDVEIVTRIVELVAMIQDGHTGVAYDNKENEYIAGLIHKYPLLLYKFTDGLYAIWADNEYKEIVGKRLLRIGNFEADEALKQIMRLNNGDNEWGKIQYLPVIQEFLQYTGVLDKSSSLLKFVYEDENGNESYLEMDNPKSALDFYSPSRIFGLNDSAVTSMNDNSTRPLPLYLSHITKEYGGYTGEFYWYEYLPKKKTMYVNVSLCIHKDDDPFDAFYKRMFKEFDSLQAENLIVDIRLNGGGQHYEMPLIKGIIDRPHIDTEDNLSLIIGRRTISASEHFATQMEIYTNATIYGEPTSARPNMVGSNTWFTLPSSKLKCRTAQNYTQDSEYWDFRLMTKPDFYAQLSSEDYKNNLDPVLSRIFMYDSLVKVREELRLALQEGYNKGGIAGLKNAFNNHKSKCVEFGINFESFFLEDFWQWVNENKKEVADYMKYIKFVVDELPNSVLANYTYARVAHFRDKNEEAKKYYIKCLELHPAHSRAIKYFNLLKLHEGLDNEVTNYGY